MREKEIREGLGKLSKTQATILYWTFEGKEPDWIARNILVINRKAYDYHVGEIYNCLGFKEKEHWTAKRERLIREVYPIFSEQVKKPEDLERWEVIKYNYQKIIPRRETPKSEEPVIFLQDTPQQKQPPESKSEKKKSGSLAILALGFLLGSVVSCFVIGSIVALVSKDRPSQLPPVSESANTTSAPIAVSLPTNTFTPTYTQTKEPTPTQTEIPTDTPIPPPTFTPFPTQVVLFFDNFDTGLSSQIQLLSGNINIVNGQLSSAEEHTILMIGDNSWTNYTVEFLGRPDSCWSSWGVNYIGLHVQDKNNMVALLWQDCEVEWYIVKNGKWKAVVNSGNNNRASHGREKVMIDVQNGNYIVNFERGDSYSLYDTTYNSGGILFILEQGTMLDNLKVVKLP